MMKLIQQVIFGIWLFAGAAQAATVAVNSTDARTWANSKGQELLQALAESDLKTKYAKLDKMMSEDVNLNYVGKFIIGKYARIMTKEQTARYNDLFYRYVLSLYKQINLDIDASGVNFSIDSIIEHPQFTTVNCTVDPSSILKNMKNVEPQKIPVKFKLIRGTDNRIQAVDVEISEVSLVIEYRKRFYQMIQENDGEINWFLGELEDMVKANERSAAARAEMQEAKTL